MWFLADSVEVCRLADASEVELETDFSSSGAWCSAGKLIWKEITDSLEDKSGRDA